MTTRFKHKLIFVMILVFGNPEIGLAQVKDVDIPMQDWLIERVEQQILLADGAGMAIENPFGDIRVRTSNDNMVSVFAVIQRHVSDEVRPELVISSSDTKMNVTVHYPEPEDDSQKTDETLINKRRVDISVLAPDKAPLSMTTRHGRAESKGHKGSLNARSISGAIIIVSKGSLDVKSERGSVHATFQARNWTASSTIETRTGDIRVLLMEHPDVLVDIDTSGNITTDYSIVIESRPGSSRKLATARIGEPSQNLAIKSDRGAVSLSRIFDMIHSGTPVPK